MKCILKLIPAILLLFVCVDTLAQSKNEIVFNKKNHETAKSSEIDHIQVVFAGDSAQKKSERGFRFIIKIKNDSRSNITVRNPLDNIGINLANDKGYNILIPYFSRNEIDDYKSGSVKPTKSYVVEKIVSNGKEIKSIDMANTDTITIPAKSSFDIYLNISQCLGLTEGKPDPSKIIQLPAGRYKIFISLGVISGKDLKSIETRALFMLPLIRINYGEK